MTKPVESHIILCDTSGCQNEAEWVVTDHPKEGVIGSRFCDPCKRDIVDYERKIMLHDDMQTKFRHEKRRFGNALDH